VACGDPAVPVVDVTVSGDASATVAAVFSVEVSSAAEQPVASRAAAAE